MENAKKVTLAKPTKASPAKATKASPAKAAPTSNTVINDSDASDMADLLFRWYKQDDNTTKNRSVEARKLMGKVFAAFADDKELTALIVSNGKEGIPNEVTKYIASSVSAFQKLAKEKLGRPVSGNRYRQTLQDAFWRIVSNSGTPLDAICRTIVLAAQVAKKGGTVSGPSTGGAGKNVSKSDEPETHNSRDMAELSAAAGVMTRLLIEIREKMRTEALTWPQLLARLDGRSQAVAERATAQAA